MHITFNIGSLFKNLSIIKNRVKFVTTSKNWLLIVEIHSPIGIFTLLQKSMPQLIKVWKSYIYSKTFSGLILCSKHCNW